MRSQQLVQERMVGGRATGEGYSELGTVGVGHHFLQNSKFLDWVNCCFEGVVKQ